MVTFRSLNSEELELPNPQYGNNRSIELVTQTHTNRGNENILFAVDNRPEAENLTMSFGPLTDTVIQEVLTFIGNTQGEQLYYTDGDYEWLGVITTSIIEVSNSYKICGKYLSLQFLGELQ